jgi:dolichol-phosphate mannosyltransferase
MITIIIPCYNEKKTIKELLTKVRNISLNKQVIVVDDCSTDGTAKILKNDLKELYDMLIIKDVNEGKGSAILAAKPFVLGNIIVIQDADLEYDPNDLVKIYNAYNDPKIDAVYGSRVLGKKRYQSKNFINIYRIFFNHLLTILSNLINNQKLTDAHTCYKSFRYEVFKLLPIKSKGFDFCTEVNSLLGKMRANIIEVPIIYNGRTYEEGKKIKISDGLIAIITLIKIRFKNYNFTKK